jgi:hypothetical protein
VTRNGQDPHNVNDVEAAWTAFVDFLQTEIDGIDQTPDSDADGFIVQWGRCSWNDGLLSLSFTRQVAIVADGDPSDPDPQPEYWQTDLTLCFSDSETLVGIAAPDQSNTGFRFDDIGPGRERELVAMRATMRAYPLVEALWPTPPVRSRLSLDRAD